MRVLVLTTSKHTFVYKTEAQRKSTKLVQDYVKKICEYLNKPTDFIDRVLKDEATLKKMSLDMDFFEFRKKKLSCEWYYFEKNGSTFTVPEADFETIVFLN